MPTLHGIDGSPFVRKVKVACLEKGVSFDQNPVMPMGVSDDYKKISPLGKIPCWTTDEGHNIPDSSCILAYLDAAHPGHADATERSDRAWSRTVPRGVR